MNKLTTLFVLALLLFVSAAPAQAAPAPQGLSIPTQLAYVDAQVNIFAGKLAEYQMSYYARNGLYFQGLASHSAPPELLASPDGVLSHPTDQTTPLSELWLYAGLPAELSWSFAVNTYNGAQGDGYVLVIQTMIEDQLFIREINVGPETYRDQPWYEVTEEF